MLESDDVRERLVGALSVDTLTFDVVRFNIDTGDIRDGDVDNGVSGSGGDALLLRDIGGLEHLQKGGHLVLSKSYKDHRVLRNQGVNAVWLQNEGAVPSPEVLAHLARSSTGIAVLFDSDATGMAAAQRVSESVNRLFPGRARPLWPPTEWRERFGAKDPADIYRKMGRKHLLRFLSDNGLLANGL